MNTNIFQYVRKNQKYRPQKYYFSKKISHFAVHFFTKKLCALTFTCRQNFFVLVLLGYIEGNMVHFYLSLCLLIKSFSQKSLFITCIFDVSVLMEITRLTL